MRDSLSTKSVLKQIQSLSEFKLQPNQTAPIYHSAITVPDFLQQNLKSQHRVIKEFSGDDALIRAFYFNLMKLAFQIESEEQNYPKLVRSILTGHDQFGTGELQDKNFTDEQYRKFILEFMQILQAEEIPNFQQSIKWYPVIDEILLRLFKQIVPVTLLIPDDSDQAITQRVLDFLTSKFKMKMEFISGCFKFIQSDIFLYVDNIKLIYLVFVDQLAFIKEVTEYPSSQIIENSRILREDMGGSAGMERKQCLSKNTILSSGGQQIPSLKSRDFKTVINILDSNKMMSSQKIKSNSRSSFEHQLIKNQSKKADNVKQCQQSPVQQYYFGSSSHSSKHTFKHSISSVKQNKVKQPSEKITSKLSINRSQKYSDQPSKKSQPNQQLMNSNSSQSHKSSKDSQSLSQFSSNQPKPSEYRSDSKIKESSSRQKITIQAFAKDKNMVRTYGGMGNKYNHEINSKFSSQIMTPSSKQSNLGLFSNLQQKQRQLYILQKRQARNEIDDSGYNKFTDSGVLQILDEQYKQQIRSIKQKYRQQRHNIRQPI